MGKRKTDEFANFSALLKRVVSVPHSEIKAQLDAEKQAKKQPRKRRASRASAAKD